ncbi:hypothetical protein [Roseiconus lacunae]|uniref:hypothetical protein n=1 Tax=Roseiconus lacunae TaxID=2605694 RepID=UPI00135CF2BE|nr:hypothetical protein [Roseiconus lacunae]
MSNALGGQSIWRRTHINYFGNLHSSSMCACTLEMHRDDHRQTVNSYDSVRAAIIQ